MNGENLQVVFDNFLSNDEIDYILSMNYEWNDGVTTSGFSRKRVVKKANITNFYPKLNERIFNTIKQLNNSYRYNIENLAQMDLLSYEKGGKYDWHQDVLYSKPRHRKFSAIIQLTDGNEYKGGDFELRDGYHLDLTNSRNKGAMLVFPSFLYHRITPIKRGKRKSIVAWIEGPTWM